MTALLTESDLRAALRLVNEARGLPRGSREQQEALLRGLLDLVGGQVAIWGEIDTGGGIYRDFDFGWSGEAERNVFVAYARGLTGVAPDPTIPLFLGRAKGPVIAVTRQDLLDDRRWYGAEHVQELRRAARVDSCIYAGWPGGKQRFGMYSLHRAWGEPQFGERERALVGAVTAECAFLRDASPVAALPPRLRQVLSLLARGRSEKQVAAQLGLSLHTVHDYVKGLHRRLGVQSRGELLAATSGA